MPSPKHPCAHPDCEKMLARKNAVHCKSHVIRTEEWKLKIGLSQKGKVIPPEVGAKISETKRLKKGQPLGVIYSSCLYCKKPFKKEKPSSKTRFCSSRCGYKNREGLSAKNWVSDMPVSTCVICGKNKRSASRKIPPITCSLRCSAIYKKMKKQKTSGTNIEKLMQLALEQEGLFFEPQFPLCAVTIADFYLPEFNIAIFCDGDYWHNLPGKTDRDKRQTKVLEDSGIAVLRFLGSLIMTDVNNCLAQIRQAVTACT